MNDDDKTRLTDLEIQLAHQSSTIDELNDTIIKQWNLIDRLTRKVNQLSERMEIVEDAAAPETAVTKPPHY